MKIRNRTEHRTLPWDTPALTQRLRRLKDSVECCTLVTRVEEVRNPRVELALDSMRHKQRALFGNQGRIWVKNLSAPPSEAPLLR